MSRKKLLLIVSVVLVLGSATGVSLKMAGRGEDGLEVEVAPVERMTIVQTVTATGRIQPKTQVNISADVSAKITKMPVEEGEWVEKGAFLLELDRERYLAAEESAEANLRVAQSDANVVQENMTKAEKDYARVKELFDRELETEERLDATYAALQAEKARHQSALDQVEQVRASLKQRQDDLSKTRIYAPMAGTISRLNKEVGEIALGSQFQEDVIMIISNLSGMEALVDVDENDIVSVGIGNTSSIEVDALVEIELGGEVSDIANSAKVSGDGTLDQKTEFEVKIAVIEPDPKLRPGMTCSADIVTDTHEEVLGVPIQSVAVRSVEQLGQLEAGEGEDPEPVEWEADKDGFVQIVWVIENGVSKARQVKTGIQSETHIEVLEGLTEGDEVVVGNYRAISRDLKVGTAVTVNREQSEDEAG
jgi:HlyD family secretion protein